MVAVSLPDTGGSNDAIYGDPFRNAKHLTPERIDMGVDYGGGTGPVFAVGPGVITESDTAWQGGYGGYPGTFIKEHITDGPLAGQNVYVAEGITSDVQVGEQVTANTVIGTLIPGSNTGIETGFASSLPGQTMAAKYGDVGYPDPGSASSIFGVDYSGILSELGAQPGIRQAQVVGTLPQGFPTSVSGAGGVTGGSDSTSEPNASDTSFIGSLFGGLLSGSGWQNALQRFGLIVFGGLFILAGVWLLAGKQTIQIGERVGKDAAMAAAL
jgi:hypothetical protein